MSQIVTLEMQRGQFVPLSQSYNKEERGSIVLIGLFLIQQINNIITGATGGTAIAGLSVCNWKGREHGTRTIKLI